MQQISDEAYDVYLEERGLTRTQYTTMELLAVASAREVPDGAFVFAGRLKGQDQPAACHFYLQQPDPFAHFAYLDRAIDSMMQTGHAPYPVERTLLTTGILDGIMTSKAEKNRRVDTPHLEIKYKPVDWPFATDPIPKAINR